MNSGYNTSASSTRLAKFTRQQESPDPAATRDERELTNLPIYKLLRAFNL